MEPLTDKQKESLLECMKSAWILLKMQAGKDRVPIRAVTHVNAEEIHEDCARVLSNQLPIHHPELHEAYQRAKMQMFDLWEQHGRCEERMTVTGWKLVFYFQSDIKAYKLED